MMALSLKPVDIGVVFASINDRTKTNTRILRPTSSASMSPDAAAAAADAAARVSLLPTEQFPVPNGQNCQQYHARSPDSFWPNADKLSYSVRW
jgi:hypothetical protein